MNRQILWMDVVVFYRYNGKRILIKKLINKSCLRKHISSNLINSFVRAIFDPQKSSSNVDIIGFVCFID